MWKRENGGRIFHDKIFMKECAAEEIRCIFDDNSNIIFVKFLSNLHNQRTNGPVNAHLISWPTKAQNIQNLENIW